MSESRIFSNDDRGDSDEEIEVQRRADHAHPETGRKHQIRKQLLISGNPILGDSKYRLSNKYS